MKRRFPSMLIGLVCLVVLISVAFYPAAASSVQTEGDCGITVIYENLGEPVPGVTFRIWRVGEIANDGTAVLEGACGDYPVKPDLSTSADTQITADTLYSYLLLNNVPADHVLLTNEEGADAARELVSGLYLVAGEEFSDGELIHRFQPQLVQLPYPDPQPGMDGKYVILKAKSQTDPISPEAIGLRVIKKWSEISAEYYPYEVKIYLLKDGTQYDSVVLSQENNWQHIWPELDANAHWVVAEHPVENFTVTVEQKDNTVVLTNTAIELPQLPPVAPSIPQTGMLWWPLPILLALSLCFLILGIRLRRR